MDNEIDRFGRFVGFPEEKVLDDRGEDPGPKIGAEIPERFGRIISPVFLEFRGRNAIPEFPDGYPEGDRQEKPETPLRAAI